MMIPVLIDCDPGIDDALAIALAVKSGVIDLKGITTVAGNPPGIEGRDSAEQTFHNAKGILEHILGVTDVPVAMGADKPLKREPEEAGYVHGADGLANCRIPEAKRLVAYEGDAASLAKELIDKYPHELVWIATAPLTNVATTLIKYPEIKKKLKKLVIMGGVFGELQGNVPPHFNAEFNWYADPEAADYVVKSSLPITVVPLDVTEHTLFTDEHLKQIPADNNLEMFVHENIYLSPRKLGTFAHKMIKHAISFCEYTGQTDGTPMHDAVAVGVVIDPHIVKTKKLGFEVCCVDGNKRGAVKFTEDGEINVALEIDKKKFLEYFISKFTA